MAEKEEKKVEDQPPKEDKQKKVGKFVRADYMISVLLQSIKNVKKIDKTETGDL